MVLPRIRLSESIFYSVCKHINFVVLTYVRVSLVFIHGLTGDRERTWKYGDAEPWPATLLPTTLPEARVLTFGYDAYVTDVGGVVSKNRVSHHAMNLVAALATYRASNDTVREPSQYMTSF